MRTRGGPDGCSSVPWVGALAGLALAAVAVTGCSKNAPRESAAPAVAEDASADVAGGGAEQEAPQQEQTASLDELEQQLTEREDDLLSAGIQLPTAVENRRAQLGLETAATAASTGPAPNRCERICDLHGNICELRELICDLTEQHADEPRYEQACERSTLDCERAEQACTECDGE